MIWCADCGSRVHSRCLPDDLHARACRQVSAIRWVPMPHFNDAQAGAWWRVYRGKSQLGHVARMSRGRWEASHLPSGVMHRPFASLRQAAMFAVGGHTT